MVSGLFTLRVGVANGLFTLFPWLMVCLRRLAVVSGRFVYTALAWLMVCLHCVGVVNGLLRLCWRG